MTAMRALVPIFVAACLAAACNRQPELDVTAGDAASPAATSAEGGTAPPIGPDAELPPGHPPISGAGEPSGMPPGHPTIPPGGGGMGMTPAAGGAGEQAVSWTTPSGWVEEQPANAVRRAQYRVPGAAGDAELAVFYFGPGQGGDPRGNAERWAAQFTDATGKPAQARTRSTKAGGMDVLLVEAEGTYLQGAMGGGQTASLPGHALLAAIVSGPDSNWFFKLTGPKATVEAQRASFDSLIGSLRRGES